MKYLIRPAMVLWLASASVSAIAQEATKEAEATVAEAPESEAEPAATQDDSVQISAASQAYLDAFNEQDVPKLVALWSPEGVYISRTSGDRIVGRKRLTEEFAQVFGGESKPKLSGSSESVEFISPNVALERGTATVTGPDDSVTQTSYRIVYVKRDGTWLIDRVTEDEIIVPLSNYQHLKDLEWMIGEWVDAGEGITIEMECSWTTNENFISRKYSVSTEDRVASSGLQVIGWYAKQQQIRSWLFDSDGGVITSEWTNGGDHWTVQSVATLNDGASGSFTSIFRPTDDGNYTWEKINRVLDGRLLPNINEIIVQRK
jgi:uncharacterized protein (TIGR02246 family)